MSAVILDSTPLGLLCHRKNLKEVQDCRQWLAALNSAGRRVIVPEIIDFEVRRELHRIGKPGPLIRLDKLVFQLEFLRLDSNALRHAAELWAQARRAGQPAASNDALDIDMILAAQALSLQATIIVATSNVAHLSPFVPADHWRNIVP